MRYRAFLNNNIFFDSYSNDYALALTSANLSFTAGKAGTFTFSVAPGNVAYDSFGNITDYVDVYRDSECIFSGRVYSASKDFNTIITVTCEGMMAVMNDSILRPTNFNGTLEELLAFILANHNSQVSADKQIELGEVTVADDYVYRAYENYESSLSRLNDLVDSYGGYMSVHHSNGQSTDNAVAGIAVAGNAVVGTGSSESGGYVLDWLAEYTDEALQEIDFGENLIDITKTSDVSDIITVLIPLGAEVTAEDGTKSKLTIAGLQEQLGNDYIENATGITLYGRIVGTQEWKDVTNPANLKDKAEEYLQQKVNGSLTINVSAVDLAGTEAGIDSFRVGEKIFVRSAPHQVADWFVCTSQSLNLLDPSQNTLQLGTEKSGYVGSNVSTNTKYQQITDIINGDYVRNRAVAEVSGRVNDIGENVIRNTTAIEENAQALIQKASKDELDATNGRLTSVESAVAQNSNMIALYFGQNGKISTWFTFDENTFQIGKANSPIHSEQDNESYRFVNDSGTILLEITPYGTVSKTVNVNAQVRYLDGDTPQWVTRKGKYITGVGVNLNDIWIGG